jgi:hypothetical protein
MDKSAVEASPESINSVFRSNFLPSLKWEKLGTILHWLSQESMSTSPSLRLGSHELLAVQDASCVTQACEERYRHASLRHNASEVGESRYQPRLSWLTLSEVIQ